MFGGKSRRDTFLSLRLSVQSCARRHSQRYLVNPTSKMHDIHIHTFEIVKLKRLNIIFHLKRLSDISKLNWYLRRLKNSFLLFLLSAKSYNILIREVIHKKKDIMYKNIQKYF